MSKFVYSSIFALTCSPAAWAGPSTSAMVQQDIAPRVLAAESTAAADGAASTERSSDRIADRSAERFAEASGAALRDTADIGPSDPHPMIPLPPAVWAGFVGLAYVARRVTRHRPLA